MTQLDAFRENPHPTTTSATRGRWVVLVADTFKATTFFIVGAPSPVTAMDGTPPYPL